MVSKEIRKRWLVSDDIDHLDICTDDYSYYTKEAAIKNAGPSDMVFLVTIEETND
jgi:hypothetical protein